MKNKIVLWFTDSVIIGLLMFSLSCKKDRKDENEKPLPDQPVKVTDIEGNTYKTATYGSHVWMTENLKTTKFNNGTDIQLITDDSIWTNTKKPGYCWFDNIETAHRPLHGALYNWWAVNTEKLCPQGWHVPSKEEWIDLIHYLVSQGYNYNSKKDTIPHLNKLAKAMASTSGWDVSTKEGSAGNTDYPEKRNISGFNAYPAGKRCENGSTFFGAGSNCDFWSTTSTNCCNAYRFSIGHTSLSLNYQSWLKGDGLSVRCVKN